VFSARIVDDQRFVVLEPVATDPARHAQKKTTATGCSGTNIRIGNRRKMQLVACPRFRRAKPESYGFSFRRVLGNVERDREQRNRRSEIVLPAVARRLDRMAPEGTKCTDRVTNSCGTLCGTELPIIA
jgi:hypothetical protein